MPERRSGTSIYQTTQNTAFYMSTIVSANNGWLLTLRTEPNHVDVNGRIIQQTMADGGIWQYAEIQDDGLLALSHEIHVGL